MDGARGGRRTLDQRQITEAALELLNEVGLAELTTRRLAAKLGVRSPTLYWHVRNKDELLDLVAEAMCADAFDIDDSLPWREQLASGLRQFRALMLRHRDAAALLRERPPTGPHRLGHIETTTRILLDAGFSSDDTVGISRLLATFVLDSVREQTAGRKPSGAAEMTARMRDFPNLARLAPSFGRMSSDALFELGVEIILDGLTHRPRR